MSLIAGSTIKPQVAQARNITIAIVKHKDLYGGNNYCFCSLKELNKKKSQQCVDFFWVLSFWVWGLSFLGLCFQDTPNLMHKLLKFILTCKEKEGILPASRCSRWTTIAWAHQIWWQEIKHSYHTFLQKIFFMTKIGRFLRGFQL